MGNVRKSPQHSVTLYPELAQMLYEAEQVTDKPKSRILYDACVRGLRTSLKEHWNNSVVIEFDCTQDDREHLRILAAKARLSQSEFLRMLVYRYGEDLIEVMRSQGAAKNSKAKLPLADNEPYYVEWRYPINYSGQGELPTDSEFTRIEDIQELCMEYSVSARVEYANGTVVGFVHNDGSYELK